MNTEKQFITVTQFCTIYKVDPELIVLMEEHDLITISYQEDSPFIDYDELTKLEQFISLHFDLGINVAGLAVIHDLLQEREELKEELKVLRKRVL